MPAMRSSGDGGIIDNMSARKGSFSGGSSVVKRSSPIHNDAEYTAAVAVLNEANMSQACELLLSEKDYDSDQRENHESDHQKLLQLFSKCEAACKTIQQRAPAVLLPTLQRGPAPAARAEAKPLIPKIKTMLPPRRGALMTQTSRLALKIAPLPSSSMPPPTRKLQHEASDSSLDGSIGSGRSAKKARLSPPTLGAPSAGGKVLAPPPAAMSFLAALNAQQQKKQEEKEAESSEEEDPPPKTRSLSPPPAGNRKQPRRSARKG
jgi:hypothetical protein